MTQEVFDDPVHAPAPWQQQGGQGGGGGGSGPQRRMEREYIWAAHETAGVNELHVVVDWFDREAWIIQDPHNQSVYGYADLTGELVEQRVYSPLGQILNADRLELAQNGQLYNGFRLRLGFQGMFVERLDLGTTSPVLRSPDARDVYLTNNRVYDPKRGVWWQRDPNATGMLALDTLQRGGLSFDPSTAAFDADTHYADGMNLSLPLGANAVEMTDPTGLFLLADIGAANYIGTGLNETEGNLGIGLIQAVEGFLNGASQQQLLIDYMVQTIFTATFSAAGAGAFDDLLKSLNTYKLGLNKNGWMATGAARAAGQAGKLHPDVGRVFDTYAAARKVTRGHNHAIEAHHILEARHARAWGLDPNKLPAVVLEGEMHGIVTGKLRRALPYGRTRPYEKSEVWAKYLIEYADHPEWLQAIRKYFQ